MAILLEILRMLFSKRRRGSIRIPEVVFLRDVLLILIMFLMILLARDFLR